MEAQWYVIIKCFWGRFSSFTTGLIDERWLEWLDSKIALLINRNGVDPRDYNGKSYDEYVNPTPLSWTEFNIYFQRAE